MNIDSFELTEFNLAEDINLGEKFGLIKITRSEDGRLILVRDGNYGLISGTTPTVATISDLDASLGFVLDIGIRKEKALTSGHGYYFGLKLVKSIQSEKKVTQADFDALLLDKIVSTIDAKYHSRYSSSQRKALQINHLLNAYNEARLLYPNFYTNSYLSLFRILDAFSKAKGRYDFAIWASKVSSDLNREIYKKVSDMEVMKSKLQLIDSLFPRLLTEAPRGMRSAMNSLSRYGKFIFVCFYSAYQYRSKFVHQGFPFPRIVLESFELEKGTSYLSSSFGEAHIKIFRPDGLQDGDTVDIHKAIRLRPGETLQDYKDFFLLLPSWHWLKRLTRAALIKEVEKLSLAA